MDALVAEGLVERRQGSGTYVVPRTARSRFLGLTSFTQDMLERGLVPASRLLAFGSSTADAASPRGCRIAIGDAVVGFTRLRLGERRADGGRDGVDPRVARPGAADPTDLDGSLYELLARRYGS